MGYSSCPECGGRMFTETVEIVDLESEVFYQCENCGKVLVSHRKIHGNEPKSLT